MKPVYSLTIAGSPTIEISQDELRVILGQIEAKLHRSKTYRRVLANLENFLGDSAEQAHALLKAVGREAIGLTFKQFVTHHLETKSIPQQSQPEDELTDPAPAQPQEDNQVVEVGEVQPNEPDNLTPEPPPQANTAPVTVTVSEENTRQRSFLRWKQHPKKITPAEPQIQLAGAERVQKLHHVGQQLRQAREVQSLSIIQLHHHTRVPVHMIQALENGDLESLPEDVYVRGFIRLLGNALRLDGTALAASLPTQDIQPVRPSWGQSQSVAAGSAGTGGFDLRPMHLYLGYTALVAGAVGGLAFLSQQSTPKGAIEPDSDSPSQKSASQSSNHLEPIVIPGLQSTTGVVVGADIAPPEASILT
ncbi:MAG: helix-turn-helix domain-containing protein [Nostocaceae cyanobacterium]|nr:helix-turn-helix domain-containing protein [Nostocaceae cyanobacterium]